MFQVRWEAAALIEMADLWMRADAALCHSLTASALDIDRQLSTSPYAASESRPGGRRVLFAYPLGVVFRIEQDEQTVSILHVWQFQRRSR